MLLFHQLLYQFDYFSCVGDYARKTSCQKTDIKSNEMHAKWLKYVIGFRLYSLETAYLYRSCKYFHQSICLLIYDFENKKTFKSGWNNFCCVSSGMVLNIQKGYSGVSNKRRPTFINFWSFFQGLRSYLGGLRLLILTKTFSQNFVVRKYGKSCMNSTFFFQFSCIFYEMIWGLKK